ncbi:nucleotidyltransferase/DNA polymerase involved in DNA repair [Desulfitobacterium dichloroeliminans LMG P-21439]|uniref:DNA polymerase IV n=1 Tax=Desulfitobacterium dichloroeliminans (strain LMG P-21439 / DCA1) TaxID=871963 RepID=L0F5Y0_DESDL|nr:DNA polymerase IV [Desulfitobacterium dichloroeliminans]AGA68450.1 nucleotidyltransferase/DNA polymerase involved in DNA repair [Desulfitobacterium dichloroeliminans LMG P-21439]
MSKHIIFHIDVNSAYLSWEAAYRLQQGDSLDLRSVPSVVGGDPLTRHGIVLAKSIPAKKYDIKTGETLYSALSKCPDLIIAKPNYLLFRQCSQALGDILKEYSPLIQQFSVDEYFVDFTSLDQLWGDPLKAAYLIKDRVKNELGFTVNIGISTNKLLAKMASEFQKPDKVHTLFSEEIPEKMWPLPIEELFMVGRATSQKLLSRNIKTIGDLAHTDPRILRTTLKSHGILIWNYAHGIENSPVRPGGRVKVKGMGNSTTLPFDVDSRKEAHLVLLSLVETVSARLRHDQYFAQLVAVSFRTHEFLSYSHQRKISHPTDCTNEIWEIACELFDELWKGQPLRHMGVRVSELCHNDFLQLSFFERDYEKDRKIDQTIDVIRERFGSHSIMRSSYLHSGLKAMTGGVIAEEEYPMMTSLL